MPALVGQPPVAARSRPMLHVGASCRWTAGRWCGSPPPRDSAEWPCPLPPPVQDTAHPRVGCGHRRACTSPRSTARWHRGTCAGSHTTPACTRGTFPGRCWWSSSRWRWPASADCTAIVVHPLVARRCGSRCSAHRSAAAAPGHRGSPARSSRPAPWSSSVPGRTLGAARHAGVPLTHRAPPRPCRHRSGSPQPEPGSRSGSPSGAAVLGHEAPGGAFLFLPIAGSTPSVRPPTLSSSVVPSCPATQGLATAASAARTISSRSRPRCATTPAATSATWAPVVHRDATGKPATFTASAAISSMLPADLPPVTGHVGGPQRVHLLVGRRRGAPTPPPDAVLVLADTHVGDRGGGGVVVRRSRRGSRARPEACPPPMVMTPVRASSRRRAAPARWRSRRSRWRLAGGATHTPS